MDDNDEGSNPQGSNKYLYREHWLAEGVRKLRPEFSTHAIKLRRNIRASIGFTRGGRSGTRAEVWREEQSAGKFIEIFIRPDVDDELEVLTLLVSVLILSTLMDKTTLNSEYKRIAGEMGLRGNKREPSCSPVLRDKLNRIVKELGPIPHDRLDIATERVGASPPQEGRMLRASCPVCKANIRLAQSTTVKPGMPICPCENVPFKLEKSGADKGKADQPQATPDQAESHQVEDGADDVGNDNEAAPGVSPLDTPLPADVPETASEAHAFPAAATWEARFPRILSMEGQKRMTSLGQPEGRNIWRGTVSANIEEVRKVVAELRGTLNIVENPPSSAI